MVKRLDIIGLHDRVQELHADAVHKGERSRHLLAVLEGIKRGRQLNLLWGREPSMRGTP